jgi:hypothetical protein
MKITSTPRPLSRHAEAVSDEEVKTVLFEIMRHRALKGRRKEIRSDALGWALNHRLKGKSKIMERFAAVYLEQLYKSTLILTSDRKIMLPESSATVVTQSVA